MQKYGGWTQDQYGNAIGGTSVQVIDVATGANATIYSDDGSTTKANPFTSDADDGSFWFYAANGIYNLVFSKAAYTFQAADTTNIRLYDPTDGAPAGTFTPSSVIIAGNGGTLSESTNLTFASTFPYLMVGTPDLAGTELAFKSRLLLDGGIQFEETDAGPVYLEKPFGTTGAIGGITLRTTGETANPRTMIFRSPGGYLFEDVQGGIRWRLVIAHNGFANFGMQSDTAVPLSVLEVHGNFAVGSSYDTVTAAPADGAIIQGFVGMGTPSPTHRLHVRDTAKECNLAVEAFGIATAGLVFMQNTATRWQLASLSGSTDLHLLDSSRDEVMRVTSGKILLVGTTSSTGLGTGGLGVAGDVRFGTALVALGGGAAATLGTIGGSGPATAGQNTWLKLIDSTGAAFWVPAWK